MTLLTSLAMTLWMFQAVPGRPIDLPVGVCLVFAGVLAAMVCAMYLPLAWLRRSQRMARAVPRFSRGGNGLDSVLFKWPDGTPFTLRDLVKSVAIWGQIGSGKTSGSGLLFARAVLKLKNSGGLILASKPEDRAFWEQRFAEAGRADDLIVFGPNEAARCNFIDHEMQRGGDARSLTQFLMVTGEALGGQGMQDEQFWKMSQERMIYNTVEAVRQGTGRISISDLQRFISTAAYTPEQIKSEAWKDGYHCQTMLAAERRPKTAIEGHDFKLIIDYWGNEFVRMDERPRSGIIAGVNNILHTYCTGIVREMVSTASTVTPGIMEKGKWVLVDFPLDVYGASGKIIMHGWKFLTQKHILRRHVKPGDAVIVVHADEAQEMVSSFDGMFLAKCRSHLGCMIYLTQSIHSYYSEIPGRDTSKADALLTNFGMKIFHVLGDAKSAEYASALLGSRRETFTNVSTGAARSFEEELMGNSGGSVSLSEQYTPLLQPAAFMSGMRSGGAADRFLVDGIAVRTGQPFANGENWQFVTFSQK